MGCPLCGGIKYSHNVSADPNPSDGVMVSVTYHNVVVCLDCGVLYNSSIRKEVE